ncbi:carotenoid oxygenase family protein [Altericroceibacterium xinjiangense]|uniref:carotenoid oxygenase family protein n=1 Tax=Altericroceibacterium xinjiangense TaxID=762261 RepID=UPI000F7E79ED|nr:carotenoid oxygenase family protein [Altericroceibacterium xinjiangense]
MEVTFPQIALYEGWGKPMRSECTVEGLELIEGKVPEELNGTWYRAGADRQYPPMNGEDIFIDGEGMMFQFRFEDGHVSYRNRWVRTPRFELQRQHRRGLFGQYRNRYTAAPEAEGVSPGTANTSMLWHGGRLMVLKEDDLPFEIDPDTLDTIEKTDLGGQVSAASLSAHPKVDWVTGELITYSFQAKGEATRDFAIYIFDPEGRKKHEVWFEAPWAGVVHDFAVTETHIIVPFFPLCTPDVEGLKQGRTFYEWHDDKPTRVAVIPRYGKAEDIRWFEGPTTSAGHMMNAVTDGTTIHLDVCLYDGNCFPFFKSPDGRDFPAVPPILTRMTFDLSRNDDGYETGTIMPVPCEMPRTDDRWQGRDYSHGWVLVRDPRTDTSTIGHVNVKTGALETWKHGQKIVAQEPQFVPRAPDSREGDGWILSILNRVDAGHSEIAVFDALDIAKGPVARLHLPVRIRASFHGVWVPDEVRESGRYEMEAVA